MVKLKRGFVCVFWALNEEQRVWWRESGVGFGFGFYALPSPQPFYSQTFNRCVYGETVNACGPHLSQILHVPQRKRYSRGNLTPKKETRRIEGLREGVLVRVEEFISLPCSFRKRKSERPNARIPKSLWQVKKWSGSPSMLYYDTHSHSFHTFLSLPIILITD